MEISNILGFPDPIWLGTGVCMFFSWEAFFWADERKNEGFADPSSLVTGGSEVLVQGKPLVGGCEQK